MVSSPSEESSYSRITFSMVAPRVTPVTRAVGQTEMDLDGVEKYSILLYQMKSGTTDKEYDANWELERIINGDLNEETGNMGSATETTQSFTKTVEDIPEGEYMAFVVANLPNPMSETAYEGQSFNTVAELKQMKFTWSDEYKNVMFGTFYKTTDATYDNNGHFNGTVTILDNNIDKDIRKEGMAYVNPTDYPKSNAGIAFTIDKDVIQPHLTTKLYRMASMISVYLDTYDLNPDVKIKIHSIALKNIPNTCYLWSNNGKTISTTESNVTSWTESNYFYPSYTKDVNNDGYADEYIKHSAGLMNQFTHNTYNYGTIFYIYENRQGVSTSTALADKTVEGNFNKATYVEIEATHYDADNTPTNILYRYAIGEDSPERVATDNNGYYQWGDQIVYNNYNVTRNRHYKVHLAFTGTGKDHLNEEEWYVQTLDLSATPSFAYDHTASVSQGTVTLINNVTNDVLSADSWSIEGSISWATLNATSGTGNVQFTYTPNASLAAGTYQSTLTVTFVKNSTTYTQDVTLTYIKHEISKVEYSYSDDISNATWTEDLSLNSYASDNTAWLRLTTTPNTEFHNLSVANPGAYTINATSSPYYSDGVYTSDDNGYIFLPLILNSGAYTNGLYAATITATDLNERQIGLIRSAWTLDNIVASCQFNGSSNSGDVVLNTQLADEASNTFAVVMDEQSFGRDGADNEAPSMLIYDDLSYSNGMTIEDTYLMKSTASYITVTVEEGQQLAVAFLDRYGVGGNVYIYSNSDFTNSTPVVSTTVNRTGGTQVLYTGALSAGTYYITTDTNVFFYYVAVKRSQATLTVRMYDSDKNEITDNFNYFVGDNIYMSITSNVSGEIPMIVYLQTSDNNWTTVDASEYLTFQEDDSDFSNNPLDEEGITLDLEAEKTYYFHWIVKASGNMRFRFQPTTGSENTSTLYLLPASGEAEWSGNISINLNEYPTYSFGETIEYSTDGGDTWSYVYGNQSNDGSVAILDANAGPHYMNNENQLFFTRESSVLMRIAIPSEMDASDVIGIGDVSSTYNGYATFTIPTNSVGEYSFYFTLASNVSEYKLANNSATVYVKIIDDDMTSTYELYATNEDDYMKVYKKEEVISTDATLANGEIFSAENIGSGNYQSGKIITLPDGSTKNIKALKMGSGQEIYMNINYPVHLWVQWHDRTGWENGYLGIMKVVENTETAIPLLKDTDNSAAVVGDLMTHDYYVGDGKYHFDRMGSNQPQVYYIKAVPQHQILPTEE